MRVIIASVLAAGAALPAHAGEIAATTNGYWFCQSVQTTPTETLYVSETFDGTADGLEVRNEFSKTLAAKYGVKPQVSCSTAYKSPGILEKLKGDHQRWYQQIRAGGGKVVETQWTFTPGDARLSYICSGGAQHMKGGQCAVSFFYTDPIEMPGSSQDKLGLAWDAWLTEQHPGWFFPAKGCTLLPADDAARKNVVDGMMSQWTSQHAEMMHVDWKYAPVEKSTADDAPSEFCQALRSDNKFWYVSPVFPMGSIDAANAAMNEWRMHLRTLTDADGMSVADSYLNGCDGPGPAKAMKHQRAARGEQIRDGGGSVIELGWIPAGARNAAAASASAAVVKTPPVFQCSMSAFGGNYMTPAFFTAKDHASLQADWSAYIKSAHPLPGVVRTGCAEVTAKTPIAPGFTSVNWKE